MCVGEILPTYKKKIIIFIFSKCLFCKVEVAKCNKMKSNVIFLLKNFRMSKKSSTFAA